MTLFHSKITCRTCQNHHGKRRRHRRPVMPSSGTVGDVPPMIIYLCKSRSRWTTISMMDAVPRSHGLLKASRDSYPTMMSDSLMFSVRSCFSLGAMDVHCWRFPTNRKNSLVVLPFHWMCTWQEMLLGLEAVPNPSYAWMTPKQLWSDLSICSSWNESHERWLSRSSLICPNWLTNNWESSWFCATTQAYSSPTEHSVHCTAWMIWVTIWEKGLRIECAR